MSEPTGQCYPAWPLPPQRRRHGANGLAIASLVLGILWLGWLGSALAVVFGHVALYQLDDDDNGGRGMAIAGLVLGWIGMGLLLSMVMVTLIGMVGA